MLLGQLLKSVSKNYQKIYVRGISFDSRKVKKRDIFFAIKGNQTSGIKFINDAISKGASAIISNKKRKYKNCQVPLILVKDVRKSLSEACSNFYKKKPANIIAVTGTNGKSSVADFFYQILNLNKFSVASIGTLGILSENYNKKTNLTSIDPLSLHKNLQILTKKKVKLKNCKIPVLVVNDVRKSLSEACSNFYKKKPSNIVAVTGTNGKSSVADFFYQILSLNKASVASI